MAIKKAKKYRTYPLPVSPHLCQVISSGNSNYHVWDGVKWRYASDILMALAVAEVIRRDPRTMQGYYLG